MNFLILIMVSFFVVPAWAEQPVTVKSTIDVTGIISNLKNPFQSQLPPPPVVVDPAQLNPGQNNNQIPNLGNNVSNIVNAVIPQKPSITVTGLVWSDIVQQAVVNSQIVGVGDQINGAKVLQINRDGVRVSYQGIEYTFTIK